MKNLHLASLPGPRLPGPAVLLVMDGVGWGRRDDGDAVFMAHTPNLDRLVASCPTTFLQAHGTAVGLPSDEDMGNSEVGHNALGAGRVFDQGAKLVDRAVADGRIFGTDAWRALTACPTMHLLGLVSDGTRHAVLTDIAGQEDHYGDMDFKVAGTREGITAIQMDIKLKRGLNFEILEQALEEARKGRLHILDIMYAALPAPRTELSAYAPRITVLTINPEKIREVIGPGGKIIRKIQEDTGANIDIDDDGTVKVAAYDAEGGRRAVDIIKGLTQDPEVGAIYDGIVRRITNFGAFVEILPNRDGLVHISELDVNRVAKVEDVCREGDRLQVKVIGVDPEGKVRLSRKALLVGKE